MSESRNLNLRQQLAGLVVEGLPDGEWTPVRMYETVRIVTAHYYAKRVTRAWACQALAEQLHAVSDALAEGRIDTGEANRHALMLIQHLELVRRFRRGIFLSQVPLVLRDLRFSGHVLQGLKLVGLSFVSCNFEKANLASSLLRNCSFTACSFDQADLTRLRFRRTEFRGCSFKHATLDAADFRTCRLLGCNLDEASVEGAKGLA